MTPRQRPRAVFLDIDGTTLRPDSSASPAVRCAVQTLRGHGIPVVLCSARSPYGIELVQEQLGTRGDVFIAYQGAMVARWDKQTLHIEHEQTIKTRAVDEIEHLAVAAGVSISAFVGLEWRTPTLDAVIWNAARITREHPVRVDSLTQDTTGSAPRPHKLLAIARADRTGLDALQAVVPDSVTASRSHPGYLEITASGIDRAPD